MLSLEQLHLCKIVSALLATPRFSSNPSGHGPPHFCGCCGCANAVCDIVVTAPEESSTGNTEIVAIRW